MSALARAFLKAGLLELNNPEKKCKRLIVLPFVISTLLAACDRRQSKVELEASKLSCEAGPEEQKSGLLGQDSEGWYLKMSALDSSRTLPQFIQLTLTDLSAQKVSAICKGAPIVETFDFHISRCKVDVRVVGAQLRSTNDICSRVGRFIVTDILRTE